MASSLAVPVESLRLHHLSPDDVGEFSLAQVAVGIAERAIFGDARKVGVGDVDAWVKVLRGGPQKEFHSHLEGSENARRRIEQHQLAHRRTELIAVQASRPICVQHLHSFTFRSRISHASQIRGDSAGQGATQLAVG